MKKRKWLFASVIAGLLLSTTLAAPGVLASSLKDLQNEQKVIEQKKQNLNSTIQKKSSEINTNKSTIDSILDQISTLNGKIEDTTSTINRVIDEINVTTEEINALRASIQDLEQKIEERDAVLRDRVRAMQVKGGQVSYIDVLLGANSFADFIDRFSAVNTLMDADRKIMKQQDEDVKQLEEEKALVEQKLAKQEENKRDLEGLKASLESQKQQKNKLIDSLEAEQAKLLKEKSSLEKEFHEAYEVSKELQAKISAEQQRLAEIAREAERKRKAAAAAAAAAKKSSSSSSSSSSSASSAPLPAVSSGSWTKPAAGTYTSSFGWRTHPIYGIQRQHRGIDIANSVGTPVVAAAEGVVSHAGSMGGYGNVVMITHSIDGQIFTSVYAHLSSISVSSGQQVAKGARIGGLGNTGASTGPHLHFEIHVGNWSASGPSAVNPLRYINL
ncbi:murein hydrolase activator EnvC [Sporosarcina sp. HYO08]|uniref:murein hydrolase activator EnvC family protein n=1 Tax=Sporosarcina sp. HYO08 TaxID=1759557 RepID=UPI000796465C|nr:peptidoglycan DD-metalloendopeptidase family protein [Sporosarcina sp. HYO08]KXH79746.1 peptidase M23 [Sporosarcina sp. HYO08]